MRKMTNLTKKDGFSVMIQDLKALVKKARYNAVYAVNAEMLKAYYEIGRRIVLEEQKGDRRAEYGERIINNISSELMKEFGKGFDVTNIRRMRRFFQTYRKWETLSPKLTWSHYSELIKIDEDLKRRYFEKYAITENLSVRDLKRQIYSLHYERLLLSKDKKALMKHDAEDSIPTKSEDVIKDPYILEFLGLEERSEYTEKELETKILDNLQKFLLELGQGFSFVARQKRITLDNEHFYIDLLFYNIYLRCYVVVELKTGRFKHEDVGQMNFYLNYVKKELNKEGDDAPIGILLCTAKDNIYVDFAAGGLPHKLFVSKYKLYLPTKQELEKEVRKLLK